MSKLYCTLLLAFVAACGSGGAPSPQVKKLIDQSGGTITSADGKLTITFPPDAFGTPCEITIEITSKGYKILPESKALLIGAAIDLAMAPPQQLPDGSSIVPVPVVKHDGVPLEGTLHASPDEVHFTGILPYLDQVEIFDSYLEAKFNLTSTSPGEISASVEIARRETPDGAKPLLESSDGFFAYESDSGSGLEVPLPATGSFGPTTGDSISTGAYLTDVPGGCHSTTTRLLLLGVFTNGQDVDRTNLELTDKVIVAPKIGPIRVIPFAQGTQPDGICHVGGLPDFAWVMPSDKAILAHFFTGIGLFNYESGLPLDNGTIPLFYTEPQKYGGCALRGSPALLQQAAPPVDAWFTFGPGGAQIRYWDDVTIDFLAPEDLETVNTTDGAPYENDPTSGGFTYASDVGDFVKFLEFSQTSLTFEVDESKTITGADLPGAAGAIVSAFRPDRGGDVLIAANGNPGELWVKTPGQAGAATLIGAVGSGVRRVRTLGTVGVVSAVGGGVGFGSLTFLARSGGSWTIGPSLFGQRSVGVDIKRLSSGNYAVASTDILLDTYRITVLAPDATILSDEIHDLPDGAEGPGHVIWLPDGGLLISCRDTDNMVRVPPVSLP